MRVLTAASKNKYAFDSVPSYEHRHSDELHCITEGQFSKPRFFSPKVCVSFISRCGDRILLALFIHPLCNLLFRRRRNWLWRYGITQEVPSSISSGILGNFRVPKFCPHSAVPRSTDPLTEASIKEFPYE
jgi:hypothetical protein